MRLNTAAAFKPNSIGKYVVYRHIIAKFDGLIVDYVFGAVDPVAVVQVGSGDDEHADEFACRVVYRAVGVHGAMPRGETHSCAGIDETEGAALCSLNDLHPGVYERAVGEGGWRPGNGSQGRGGQDAPESVSNRQFAPNLSL
ncbi:Uncharacterised protein [Mycobacteroides abscessus]|nr:Uncharacterised protein [Mycobacteroides abscessus]